MTSLHYLREYFEKLDQEFHIKYMEVIHDYQQESVHDLRVTIKKLVAFSEFLAYLNPDYDPELYQKTLNVIHSKAGDVRNVQIEEKLIQEEVAKHHIFSKLQKKLSRIHEKVQNQYQDFEAGHSLIAVRLDAKEVRKHIRQLNLKGLYKKIHLYFLSNIASIKKQIKSPHPAYHQIRKDIKELLYNLLFMDSFPGSYQVDPKLINELKQIADIIGQWNDIHFTITKMLSKEKLEKPLRKALNKDLDLATKQMVKSLNEFSSIAKRVKKQLEPLLKSIGEADKKNIHGSFEQANIGDLLR